MAEYVYQEYPKCLYRKDREPVTVVNEEEEQLFISDGYVTAAQFHGYTAESVAEPVQTPVSDPVLEPELWSKKKKKKDEPE